MYYLESVHQHVRLLGVRWAVAERDGDTEALAELLARDFVFVGPRGTMIDRDRYLYARISGELLHHHFNWDAVHMSVYPDAVVAIGTLTQRSTFGDSDASGEFRATQVLARQADHRQGWKIACIQLTRTS